MDSTAQKEKETAPATELELGTYCTLYHGASATRVTGVLLSSGRLRPVPQGWYCVRQGKKDQQLSPNSGPKLHCEFQHASHQLRLRSLIPNHPEMKLDRV